MNLQRGSHVIVSAAILAEGKVLLVRQPGPDGPGTVWALPGGRVDAGELAIEAVRREVAEETGLKLTTTGTLVSIGQFVNPTEFRRDPGEIPGPGETATVFVYAFSADAEALSAADDPDAEIAEASWVPADEAYALVNNHPFPFMRSVSAAAIKASIESTDAVAVHYFRRSGLGEDEIVS